MLARIIPVFPQDGEDAMIYRDGILNYDAHDAYLRSMGYDNFNLPCKCGGTEDDGHLPCCGWGKIVQPELTLTREYVGEELAIFWESPFGHGREKIASFWWPIHPAEDTHEVERIFEALADKLVK